MKPLFALRGSSKKTPSKMPVGRRSRKPKNLTERITAAGDRMAFAWKVREALYRHLSVQVGHGVTVETALDTFRSRLQRRKKVSSDKIVASVAHRMRDGATLAAALSNWIPQDEISIISSGELSGRLPQSLDLTVEAKRRIARVNNAFKSSMVHPAIYVVVVYAMLWAIGAYVTPGLQQALPKEKSAGLVYGLYVAGDLANSWWAILPLIVLAALVLWVARSLPTWTGRGRIAAERFFPFSFYRDVHGYTWLMSFAALMRAGMADVDILKRQAAEATPWMKERLTAFHWHMMNGSSLSKALLAKGKKKMPAFGFPNPDIVDDIASMDGFRDFPQRVTVLATQWAEELEAATLARVKVFGFVMDIAMYAVMGLLMLAINAMSTQVGNVPGM